MDIFMREGKLVQGYKAIKSEFHKFLERNILGKEVIIEFTNEDEVHRNGFVNLIVNNIKEQISGDIALLVINNTGIYVDNYIMDEQYLIIRYRDKNTACITKEDGESWK